MSGQGCLAPRQGKDLGTPTCFLGAVQVCGEDVNLQLIDSATIYGSYGSGPWINWGLQLKAVNLESANSVGAEGCGFEWPLWMRNKGEAGCKGQYLAEESFLGRQKCCKWLDLCPTVAPLCRDSFPTVGQGITCGCPLVAAGTSLLGSHSLSLPSDLRRATGRLLGVVPGAGWPPVSCWLCWPRHLSAFL